MSQPLTDAINALTTYANSVTGASDTTLSDAVDSLVAGYGGGGTPGSEFVWATAQVVTVGANTVANMTEAKAYFDSYTYSILILISDFTINNQLVWTGVSGNARWRNNAVVSVLTGTSYDAKLVEGSQYLLLV